MLTGPKLRRSVWLGAAAPAVTPMVEGCVEIGARTKPIVVTNELPVVARGWVSPTCEYRR